MATDAVLDMAFRALIAQPVSECAAEAWRLYYRLLHDFSQQVAFSDRWKLLGDAVTHAERLARLLDRLVEEEGGDG